MPYPRVCRPHVPSAISLRRPSVGLFGRWTRAGRPRAIDRRRGPCLSGPRQGAGAHVALPRGRFSGGGGSLGRRAQAIREGGRHSFGTARSRRPRHRAGKNRQTRECQTDLSSSRGRRTCRGRRGSRAKSGKALAAFDGRIPRIVVVLPPGTSDARVSVDGSAEAADPKGIEADPGEHQVVVEVSGRPSIQERIVLAPSQRKELTMS